jgi:hypothetical protein
MDRETAKEARKIAKREERSLSYIINLFVKKGLRKPEGMKRLIQRTPGKYARN